MVKRKRKFKRTTRADGTCGRHMRTDAWEVLFALDLVQFEFSIDFEANRGLSWPERTSSGVLWTNRKASPRYTFHEIENLFAKRWFENWWKFKSFSFPFLLSNSFETGACLKRGDIIWCTKYIIISAVSTKRETEFIAMLITTQAVFENSNSKFNKMVKKKIDEKNSK